MTTRALISVPRRVGARQRVQGGGNAGRAQTQFFRRTLNAECRPVGAWGSRQAPPSPQTTAAFSCGAPRYWRPGPRWSLSSSPGPCSPCDAGTREMQAISNAIREGAEAFMSRQYGTIAIIAAVLAVRSLHRIPAVALHCALRQQGRHQLPDRRHLLRALRLHRHVRLHPREYPHGQRRPHQPGQGPADRPARRRRHRPVVVTLSLLGIGILFLALRRPQASPGHAL